MFTQLLVFTIPISKLRTIRVVLRYILFNHQIIIFYIGCTLEEPTKSSSMNLQNNDRK
jgi:hypothetical protein